MRQVRLDTKSIALPTPAAAKAWAGHLNCSVAELRIAIRAVGTSVDRVRAYLGALCGRGAEAPGRDGGQSAASG